MARPSTTTHPFAQYRREKGLDRPAFAKMLGITPGTLQSIELGKRPVTPCMDVRFAGIRAGKKQAHEALERHVENYRKQLHQDSGLSFKPTSKH